MRPAVDLKLALRAYVLGHDAGHDVGTKLRIAERELDTEGVAGNPGPATAAPVEADGRGVPVPERLDFHRSAGTWRDRVPGLRRGA
jgi:hypothetical protein